MIDQILQALSQLNRLSLSRAKRIESLMMFSFGDLVESIDKNGNVVVISAFSLHVQCPWRMLDSNGNILVGSGDALEKTTAKFNPAVLSENLCDQRFHDLFCQFGKDELRVERTDACINRGISIFFKGGLVLEVIPIISKALNQWK